MQITGAMLDGYKEDGYLLVPELFTSEEIALIAEQLPSMLSEDSSGIIRETNGEVRSLYGAHQVNEVFDRLCRLNRILRPVQELLESDVYIHQSKVNIKKAFKGDWWEWHQDFPYWRLDDGMPAPRVVSVMIFLDEITHFNGPLCLIPGSHKVGIVDFDNKENVETEAGEQFYLSSLSANLKYTVHPGIVAKWFNSRGVVVATGKPGTALFFHGNVFHASNSNLSPADRKVFIVTYNSTENKLGAVERERPSFLANRDTTPLALIPDEHFLPAQTVAGNG